MQFSIFDTIQSHIKDFSSQLSTCLPAIVESYDPEESTVSCYPAIYKSNKDGVVVKDHILERVPVVFSSTKNYGLTFPLEKGDELVLVVFQQDSENWLVKDDQFVKPKTHRKHNINDCVAIPANTKYSTSPVKPDNANNINLYFNNTDINIRPDGSVAITTENGNSLIMNADGSVDVNVEDKFSVTNSSGELVDWISQLTQLVSEITVNTTYGASPINNKPAVDSLKSTIDTMKK